MSHINLAFIAQLVKNPPAVQETAVWFLGQEDPLEKGKATHSSTLTWRIPWTVQSMRSQSRTQLNNFHVQRKYDHGTVVRGIFYTISFFFFWWIKKKKLERKTHDHTLYMLSDNESQIFFDFSYFPTTSSTEVFFRHLSTFKI